MAVFIVRDASRRRGFPKNRNAVGTIPQIINNPPRWRDGASPVESKEQTESESS